MKFNKKLSIALCASIIASTAAAIPVSADFEKTDSGYVYVLDNGKNATGWQTIDGHKYYFTKDGIMKTGWLKFKSGKTYYLRSNGQMATGKLKIKGVVYDFGKDGVLVTDSKDTSKDTSESKPSKTSNSSVNAKIEKLREENKEYQRKIDALTPTLNSQKDDMDYYYDIYKEYKAAYDKAYGEEKGKVMEGDKYADVNNYKITSLKRDMEKAEIPYKEAAKKYNKTKNEVDGYKRKIASNDKKIKELQKKLK